ncbi:hypothetical protein BREVNS_0336 [Brevinematales bacterium NS]|nr:hypothetical protein BREVNS_0336 [Brevinematales bacterium NS]
MSGQQVEQMIALKKMYGISLDRAQESKNLMAALSYFAMSGEEGVLDETESGRALAPLVAGGAVLTIALIMESCTSEGGQKKDISEFLKNLEVAMPENEKLKKFLRGEKDQGEGEKKEALKDLIKITNQYKIFTGGEGDITEDLPEITILQQLSRYRKEAISVGLERYGGKSWEKVLKEAGTNKQEFSQKLEQKIIRAAGVKKNVHVIDLNSEEGRKVKKEYEYFAKITTVRLGGNWEEVKKWWDESNFFMIGEEGMGNGYKPKGFRGHFYNDRITVFREGKIVEFMRANVDPEDEKRFGTVASNLYGMFTMKREGKSFSEITNGVTNTYEDYLALKLSNLNTGKGTNWYDIPQDSNVNGGINPSKNKEKGQPEWGIWGALVHPGGPTYNWSEGCQTIYYEDYPEFMELFWDKKLNEGKGGYRYDLVGYYFLLTQ